MHTPFFPALRPRLAALGRRAQQVRQQSLTQLERLLQPWLPPGLLAQADEGANSRERVYSIRRTLFGFLYQVLKPDCSCREVVRQIQARCLLQNQAGVQAGTSAYCQARKRLPRPVLQRLRTALAAAGEKSAGRWHGLRPKVIDATTIGLPDTPANQRAYPQSRSQQPGCGFPLLKLVGIFCLGTGHLLHYAKGNKHHHDLRLWRRLLAQFQPGDVMLADRGFCSYVVMALLQHRAVHTVLRLHQSRPADLRKGRRLGKKDRLWTWSKPNQKPRWLAQTGWNKLPAQRTVRVLRFDLHRPGYRSRPVTLVTTLLDPHSHPAQAIAELYARRWHIELWFRDIKTSLGMEVLRCKTPPMVHRELEMFLIGYNFVRSLMLEAAASNDVALARISFKGTVDSIHQFSQAIAQAHSKNRQRLLGCQLLEVIASDQVPDRPGRSEPRATKRRPKTYARLTRPRRFMKVISHRNHYRKPRPAAL